MSFARSVASGAYAIRAGDRPGFCAACVLPVNPRVLALFPALPRSSKPRHACACKIGLRGCELRTASGAGPCGRRARLRRQFVLPVRPSWPLHSTCSQAIHPKQVGMRHLHRALPWAVLRAGHLQTHEKDRVFSFSALPWQEGCRSAASPHRRVAAEPRIIVLACCQPLPLAIHRSSSHRRQAAS